MGVLVDSIYQNKFFVENLIILTSVLQIYTVCEGMICEGYVFLINVNKENVHREESNNIFV